MKLEISFSPSSSTLYVDFCITQDGFVLFHAVGIPDSLYTLRDPICPIADGSQLLIINLSDSVIAYHLTPDLVHSFHEQHEAFGNSLTDAWIDSLGVLND